MKKIIPDKVLLHYIQLFTKPKYTSKTIMALPHFVHRELTNVNLSLDSNNPEIGRPK